MKPLSQSRNLRLEVRPLRLPFRSIGLGFRIKLEPRSRQFEGSQAILPHSRRF
jgi:hypothetical protein